MKFVQLVRFMVLGDMFEASTTDWLHAALCSITGSKFVKKIMEEIE